MQTEKIVTLISGAADYNNFTVTFGKKFSVGDNWEVALTQAHIPHRPTQFADTFKSQFTSNQQIANLKMYYDISGSGTTLKYHEVGIGVDDIVRGLGDWPSKADILKIIFNLLWNAMMVKLKSNSVVWTSIHLQDSAGNPTHQTLEVSAQGLKLKGCSAQHGYLYLDTKLAQMLDIVDAAGTKLGRGVRYNLRGNLDVKATTPYQFLAGGIHLFSNVDWVFDSLYGTPWSMAYGMVKEPVKHVDVHCDAGQAQAVNGVNSQVMLHAKVTQEAHVISPPVPHYVKVPSLEYKKMRVWITELGSSMLATLPRGKTRVTLHFRQKGSNFTMENQDPMIFR